MIYAQNSVQGSLPASGGYTNTIALSNKIDKLSGVNISGGSISNASVSGLTGLTTSDIGGFAYATSSDFITIATWGDSITYGSGGVSYPSQLSNLTGVPVYNGGVNALTSTQIAALMLAATDKYSYPTIIWAGRNDITGVLATDEPTILANIASMVSALTTSHYLVLGLLNYSTEISGSTNYNEVVQINTDLAALYGSHYWDVRTYLVSQYDPTQPQDVTDHSNDVLPTSLRFDSLHPNAAGNLKIAQYLQQHISLLIPAPTTSLLTTQNLTNILQKPFSFSYLDTTSGYKQGGNIALSMPNRSVAVGSPNAAAWMAATSTAFYDVALGYNALGATPTNSAGLHNTALGALTLSSVTTGGYNTASGYQALYSNTTGLLNTAIGVQALTSNTTGTDNVGVGVSALNNNTTGSTNISLGDNSLNANTTGSNNFAGGYMALRGNMTGSRNVVIGFQAIGLNTVATSTQNVAVGYQAGYSIASSSNNVFVGNWAGYGVTTGGSNIWIGAATSSVGIANLTTGSQNILIGNNISLPSATANGQLDIGNIIYGTGITTTGSTLSTGNIGIATTTPWRTLSVNGTVSFTGLTSDSADTKVLCLTSNNEVVANAGTSCITSSQRFKNRIEPLATSSGLAEVLQLSPVSFQYNSDIGISGEQVGFIAEQVQQVDPRLVVLDASSTPFTVRYENLTAVLARAIQEIASITGAFKDVLIAWLGNAGNGIGDLFATTIHADNGDFTEVNTQKLCIGSTCVTENQLKSVLANTSPTSGSAPPPASGSSSTTPDTTQPTITINGNNPTHINVGDSYADLGATVTDNVDQNLGLKYFLNGTLVSNIVIETSAAATDTIDYVATDTAGNTATSTRTVIVETI